MLIVTQGCNRVYYMGTSDTIDVEDGRLILVRHEDECNPLRTKKYVLGYYEDTATAQEVLKSVIKNIKETGGLILPDE